MVDRLLIPKAYVEILEILKYIPLDDYNKIPSEIIEEMHKSKDKDYKYKVTNFENFQEQKMLKETETILAVLFQDYWATEEERKKIIENDNYKLRIIEDEKRKKYNPSELFTKETKNKEDCQTSLIEYKKSIFFKRIIDKIVRLIRKNKRI